MGSLKRVEKKPLSLHKKISNNQRKSIYDRLSPSILCHIHSKLSNDIGYIFTINLKVYRQLKRENIDETM
jgi:hypothetical protein